MSLVVRKTVRVLLINEEQQLLLMCIEDFDISSADGTRNKRFWCTIGGGIEEGETIEHAAQREIYEETGITSEDISVGPRVWHMVTQLSIAQSLKLVILGALLLIKHLLP